MVRMGDHLRLADAMLRRTLIGAPLPTVQKAEKLQLIRPPCMLESEA